LFSAVGSAAGDGIGEAIEGEGGTEGETPVVVIMGVLPPCDVSVWVTAGEFPVDTVPWKDIMIKTKSQVVD